MGDQPATSQTVENARITALRGGLVYCRDDPFLTDPAKAFVYEPDGLVICRDGVIQAVGDYSALKPDLPADCTVEDHSGHLIAPGFIDTHIHFPQIDVIAAHGKQLLDWLEQHTCLLYTSRCV